MAKEWPLYFCRLFPVAAAASNNNKHYSQTQMLAISHAGLRLIRRERDAHNDALISIEYFR
jgi:hypothetical protein